MWDTDQNNDPGSHNQREKELFFSALEIEDPEKRSIWLREACGKDESLFERLEGLLAAGVTEGMDFLSPNEDRLGEVVSEMGHELRKEVIDPDAETVGEFSSRDRQVALGSKRSFSEGPGDIIGRYKLLEKIGEGGGGVVYMANQTEPVKRRVALKVIKLGMDTRQVVARFEAERQALAMMEHPNIASILDAGATESGRPYFVMELVRGVPITTFCDENKLGTKERLELFRQVCAAVQHAHQKGIIHRDLKPGNVLVTMMEDRPLPKVIDFGIAKATQQELTEKTLFTQHGQFIGTPAYMSPEQASMTGYDIDTRSDIYSLGVLLYELLAGAPPFDHKSLLSAGFNEMRRIIAEDEPPKPSTRCTETQVQANSGTATGSKPKKFHLNPSSLKGELDWVVMKALEKDRTRRYETANAFAADIGRYLSDEPVEAAAPSATYQLKKFVRRHRSSLVVALVIAILLITGTTVSTWQALDAQRANKDLAKERDESSALAEQNRTLADDNQERGDLLAARLSKARIALAERQWDVGNLTYAKELLEDCPPEHRQWEWHLLKQLCQSEFKTFRDFHPHVENSMDTFFSMSPDGSEVAYSTKDGVIVRSSLNHQSRSLLKGELGKIEKIVLSPDWKTLAGFTTIPESLGKTGEIRLWDVKSGSLKHVIEVKDLVFPASNHTAFSPDSARFILASTDIRQWDIQTGKLLSRSNRDQSLELDGIAVTSDGLHVVSVAKPVSEDFILDREIREVVLIRIDSGEIVNRFSLNRPNARHFALGPDDQLAITDVKCIEVWNLKKGEQLFKLPGHLQEINSLAFTRDGKHLLSGGWDKTVRIWDLEETEEIRVIHGQETPVQGVAGFSAKGPIVSVGTPSLGGEGEIVFWGSESTESEPYHHLTEDGSRTVTLVRKLVGSPSHSFEVRAWNTKDPDKDVVTKSAMATTFANLSPNARYLVWDRGEPATDFPAEWKNWLLDTTTGEVQQFPIPPFFDIMTSDIPAEERSEETLELSKIMADGMAVAPWKTQAFSPDSTRLAVIPIANIILVWDVASREVLTHTTPKEATAVSIAWHPDPTSNLLAYESSDSSISIWDHARDEVVLRFQTDTEPNPGHFFNPQPLAFDPQGERLASVSQQEPGTIKIWSATAGELLHRLPGHNGGIDSLEFSSPLGKRLASRGKDGTLRFWDTETGEEVVSLPIDQIRQNAYEQSKDAVTTRTDPGKE